MAQHQNEKWLPVPGYVGRYCVSDQGNVMSMDYMNTGLPGLMKPCLSVKVKYKVVNLRRNAKSRTWLVHVLVAAAFLGERKPGMQVNHLDGDKLNNRLSNLEYCTASENQIHAIRTGLRKSFRGGNSRRPNPEVLQ